MYMYLFFSLPYMHPAPQPRPGSMYLLESTGVVRACMQAWQAWKLSLVRQEGVDASSFCLAGGRVFCTVDDGVELWI